MDLVQHGLREHALLFGLGTERIQETLVLAGRHEAPLDPQFFHQAGEAEAVHQHADAADDAGLVHEDLVGRRRDVVSGRGARLFHHRVDRLLVLGFQALDLVVDDAGLHRAAAGRIDAHDDRLRAGILERVLDAGHQVLGACLRAVGDFAVHFDQRGVRARWRGDLVARDDDTVDERDHEQQPAQAEEDAPAALAAPVHQVRARKLLGQRVGRLRSGRERRRRRHRGGRWRCGLGQRCRLGVFGRAHGVRRRARRAQRRSR